MPTKKFPTLRAIAWLKQLAFPEIDPLEINHLLADLQHIQRQLDELENVIAERCVVSDAATLLAHADQEKGRMSRASVST